MEFYGLGTPSPVMASFFNGLFNDGWSTVEIAWSAPGVWEGEAGQRTLACRYATLVRWIYDNIHARGKSAPFIANGFSAGASQIAFAISYYDSASILDLAVFVSGPPYCPGCCAACATSAQARTELFMSGTPRLAYPPTSVAFVLGAADTLPNVVPNAKLYYEAVTTRKSIEVLAGIDHLVPFNQTGSDAILRAIRELAPR